MIRLLPVVAATLAATALAAPADAAPKSKTMKQTYAVSLPVPFPVMEDIPGYHGCWNGEEGVSKHTREIKLPAPGTFKAELSHLGDWDLYLFDTKDNILSASENADVALENPGVEKLTWKKAKKGQTVRLIACNWAGPKDGTVSWTFTYTVK